MFARSVIIDTACKVGVLNNSRELIDFYVLSIFCSFVQYFVMTFLCLLTSIFDELLKLINKKKKKNQLFICTIG